jgi:hypothetical protein
MPELDSNCSPGRNRTVHHQHSFLEWAERQQRTDNLPSVESPKVAANRPQTPLHGALGAIQSEQPSHILLASNAAFHSFRAASFEK